MAVTARLVWLLLGVALGVAGMRVLAARRAPGAVATPATPVAALPRPTPPPSGRHAWVPPPDTGADRA